MDAWTAQSKLPKLQLMLMIWINDVKNNTHDQREFQPNINHDILRPTLECDLNEYAKDLNVIYISWEPVS